MYWLKLEVEGKLLGAGPLAHGVGLAIVLADDLAEAERIAADEPMNRLGYRTTDVQPWSLNEGLAVSLARRATSPDQAG